MLFLQSKPIITDEINRMNRHDIQLNLKVLSEDQCPDNKIFAEISVKPKNAYKSIQNLKLYIDNVPQSETIVLKSDIFKFSASGFTSDNYYTMFVETNIKNGQTLKPIKSEIR
ncbi:unnamed protein product, partial [Didymodactylos carnosus]